MSGREDYHGVRSGEKRKAEVDEATLGVAPKLPKTAAEKDRFLPQAFSSTLAALKTPMLLCRMSTHARVAVLCLLWCAHTAQTVSLWSWRALR